MWCDAPSPLLFLLIIVIAFCIADHNLGRMGAFDWWVFVVAAVAIVVVAMCFFFLRYCLIIRGEHSVDCAFLIGLCSFFLQDGVHHYRSDCGAGSAVGSEDAD